ncbi:hypothetical protein FRC20_011079 [Serendipita sp. 405]|nr:hypothetical protein FRC20_011079 [Serendipita sp. 405]
MFKKGLFSSDPNDKERVDAGGLCSLTISQVGTAMQVTSENPMSGLDGRAGLLQKLGQALKAGPKYFGEEGRVGNLLQYLKTHTESQNGATTVHISKLWEAVMLGLAPIWPTDRTKLNGVPLGDVWRCESLRAAEIQSEGEKSGLEGEVLGLVPFHKLSQWLTYSLVEPIEKLMGWRFEGMGDMTGLPEYRNGGLLVDLGVLTLRPNVLSSEFYPDPSSKIPRLPPSHPAIIEWRAMTVIELDRIADQLRTKTGANLSLVQVLESATWKGGREIAKQLRGDITGGGPPIEIESDDSGREDALKSAWDYYNDDMKIVEADREKEWEENMNTILIVASLLAAIVAAFLIETTKLLREDTNQTLRDATIHLSAQYYNSSIGHYETSPFRAKATDVTLNSLLIISLSLDLVAAVVAMLIKQWNRELDRGLRLITDPRDQVGSFE